MQLEGFSKETKTLGPLVAHLEGTGSLERLANDYITAVTKLNTNKH